MFDWQQLVDWLQLQFQALLNALDPYYWLQGAAQNVADMLPDASPATILLVGEMRSAIDVVVPFIALADYVVVLPLYIVVIGGMLVVEAVLQIYRAWRMVRSLLT